MAKGTNRGKVVPRRAFPVVLKQGYTGANGERCIKMVKPGDTGTKRDNIGTGTTQCLFSYGKHRYYMADPGIATVLAGCYNFQYRETPGHKRGVFGSPRGQPR